MPRGLVGSQSCLSAGEAIYYASRAGVTGHCDKEAGSRCKNKLEMVFKAHIMSVRKPTIQRDYNKFGVGKKLLHCLTTTIMSLELKNFAMNCQM